MKSFKAKKLTILVGLCLGAALSAPVFAEETHFILPDIAQERVDGALVLHQQFIVEQLVQRNAQIIYAQMQQDIAKQQITHERGAFELEFFSSARYEDSNTQASANDRTSALFQNQATFDQKQTQFEAGITALIESGAEVRVSYQTNKKTNNFIPLDTFSNGEDTEYKGSINIAITQPLLKGRGATQIDARILKAELEYLIVLYQLQQRIMRTSFDGLSAYWQLYRLNEFKAIREESLSNAQNTLEDIARRVDAGRLPETSLLEAQSNVFSRQAQLEAVLNEFSEAESRIKSLLNFSLSDVQTTNFKLLDSPDESPVELGDTFQSYFMAVLNNWPAYKIAQLQQKVFQQDLRSAEDNSQPKLDLVVGYSTNGLGFNFNDSNDDLLGTDFPAWHAGLNFSMPLQGNQRALSQVRIAKTRIQQAAVDMNSVEIVLANDLRTRFDQMRKAHNELKVYRENVSLLERLLQTERELFDSGSRRLSDVYDRESRLNEGKQGYIGAKIKYEISKLSLYLAEGSLLSRYNVSIADLDTQGAAAATSELTSNESAIAY